MKQKFVGELVARLCSKNPKFFDYIQIFSLIVMGISFLLGFMRENQYTLPSWTTIIEGAAVKISALTAVIIAELPNQTK